MKRLRPQEPGCPGHHVVGGKLTTYRRMTQDGVDAAIEHAGLEAGPCRTRTLPLVGAAPAVGLHTLDEPRSGSVGSGSRPPWSPRWNGMTLRSFEPIAPGVPLTQAELRFLRSARGRTHGRRSARSALPGRAGGRRPLGGPSRRRGCDCLRQLGNGHRLNQDRRWGDLLLGSCLAVLDFTSAESPSSRPP